MHGTEDDNLVSGSGNLANALDHISGFDDDFLTGDDVTIAQIHSLASSKPSAPITTPPMLTVPETSSDPAFSLPSQSPRTISDETETTTTEPAPIKYQVSSLPSPGRTTSNTSSMVSSEAGAGPIVSPLPKISPRSNMSSPGRKPKSSMDYQQPSSSTDTAATGAGGTPKPRRPSGSGGLPRVAMLAANKPAPKREEPQRNTPPPFRSGGSSVRPSSVNASAASGRGRSPGTPGALGTSTSSRERLSGASSSSSPATRGGLATTGTGTGGVSRSSSRSSIASGSSSSRLVSSSSTNSRPAWGAPPAGGSGAPVRSTSVRSTSTGGTRTPTPGTGIRSSQSGRTPPSSTTAGTTQTTTGATRRTVSTSSVGSGRGRVVARSSSPSKIPSGPGRTTSTRTSKGPSGAAAAVATGAAVAVAKAAVVEPEEVSMDTLVGLMGEIKDIRHALDMNTPTSADGAENPEFGSAVIEVEDSLPGPEFIASVENDGVIAAEGGGDDGELGESLEKKESVGGGQEESERGVVAAASGEGIEGEKDAVNDESGSAVVVEEPAVVLVEQEPPTEVTVRPAFEQHFVAEQEKIQAKPLCSCSIM